MLLKVYDTSPLYRTYRDDPRFPELRVGLPFFLITNPEGDVLYKTSDFTKTEEMVLFLSTWFLCCGAAMNIVVHHTPDCGTSRNVLAIIRAAGHEPTIVPYLEVGWTRPHLLALFAAGASRRVWRCARRSLRRRNWGCLRRA